MAQHICANPLRPRIVALTHEFYPSHAGIAVYTQEVAAAAARAGYPIEVWAPHDDKLAEFDPGYPVRPLPFHGTQGWPSRIKLARHLKRQREYWQDSLLWLPEPGPLRAWMYFRLVEHTPLRGLVITLHGTEINLFSSNWYRRRLFQAMLASADRIGVVSNYGRDQLLGLFPELEPRVHVTHGALRSVVSGTREHIDGGFKNGKIHVLTVGRIHPRKGQMAVIEALGLLPESIRERFFYKTVGHVRRPAYLKQMEQRAAELGVRYEHQGEVDNARLDDLYSRADIFAMTSEPTAHSVEGFGLTYLEASAHGLPIVAHRTGGVSDAVRDGFNGLKVEPGDREGLSQVFARLAADQQLRAQLGGNGYDWAHSFSWDSTAEALFDGIGV